MIDSIQTMYLSDLSSAPGSVTQVRECAANLMRLAKSTGISMLIVGHVTKEGHMAGPRVLEHLVDTVLYFEGDDTSDIRTLRSVKNRFGASHEIGLFEMTSQGLQSLTEASKFFLTQRATGSSGSIVFPSLEGSRPVLVEIQALVNESYAPAGVPPVRRVVGLDRNRLSLLVAVLNKLTSLGLGRYDIYAKTAGGLNLTEPALDLPLVLAIASSRKDQPLPADMLACGEIGLGGEVRAVTGIERRVQEGWRMGFQRFLIPAANADDLKLITYERKGATISTVATVREALQRVALLK